MSGYGLSFDFGRYNYCSPNGRLSKFLQLVGALVEAVEQERGGGDAFPIVSSYH